MRRFVPALLGLGLGAVFGLGWWFLWGCRFCAPGATPFGPLVFTTLMGALVGHFLGRDYVRR